MELKTARLTILIDPAKKQAFEELCHTQDMTPSQVVRRLIRDFMEGEDAPAAAGRSNAPRKAAPVRKLAVVRKAPAARKR
ncbi:MAG TPA: CopG family transcriptional regulator [Ramlibacter sp.]|nr:CopG family transcriptional regulator [Ramlibacter sp.]